LRSRAAEAWSPAGIDILAGRSRPSRVAGRIMLLQSAGRAPSIHSPRLLSGRLRSARMLPSSGARSLLVDCPGFGRAIKKLGRAQLTRFDAPVVAVRICDGSLRHLSY
jgi:hypothetical protein